MYVTVNVQLGPDETLALAKEPSDAAAEILAVFGGDPTTDTCYVAVATAVSGTAGPVTDPAALAE